MADTIARVQLARLAQSFRPRSPSRLPVLVFFTDDARVPDPLPAIRALPPGSMVILRAKSSAKRRVLAQAVAPIARSRGLTWIIAGDPVLAAEMHAHGVHFAESNIAAVARWRVKRPRWLITCAAHSLSACARASRSGVNAIFLAPVFATQSHPGRPHLGPLRTRMMANLVATPIYALGGIDSRSARRLSGARLAGLAVIGALTVDRDRQ